MNETTVVQPSLSDRRLARRRELEAALAALDALEGLARSRRDLARLVAEAPDAASARAHLASMAAAIDAEEAAERGAAPPANGATVSSCPKCGHVGVRDGPCPGCRGGDPEAEPPAERKKANLCRNCNGRGFHEGGGEVEGEPTACPECGGSGEAPPPAEERPPEPLDGLFVSPADVRRACCADKLANVKKGPAAVTPVLVEGVPHVCTGCGGPDQDGACFAWLIPLTSLSGWEGSFSQPEPSHQPQPGETNETAYRGRLVSVKGRKYVMEGKQAQRTVVWTEPKKRAGPPASSTGKFVVEPEPELAREREEARPPAPKKGKNAAPAKNPCPDCEAEMLARSGGFWCRKCGHGGYDAVTREAVAEAKETMALREKLGADLCLSRGPGGARCDSERGHAGGHTWRPAIDPVEEAGHKTAVPPPSRADAPPHRACRICGIEEGHRNFIQPTLCAACEGFEPLGKHALLGGCRLTLWSHPDGRAVARAAPGELGNWHDDLDADGVPVSYRDAENVPTAADLLAAVGPLCDSGGPLEIDDCSLLEDRTLVISLGPAEARGEDGEVVMLVCCPKCNRRQEVRERISRSVVCCCEGYPKMKILGPKRAAKPAGDGTLFGDTTKAPTAQTEGA